LAEEEREISGLEKIIEIRETKELEVENIE